ncbi:hypothetical protein TGVAND_250220 [Toxoplasma gondii VAND]|uniref:Uncharacterized protein n=4 Tax=Toxoplasma gondii TaxID=5811 RepID=A0A086KXL4_TOXGO|nr:hypothetical protein TGP89_250220 [Toxoplasma gondii p89]KFH11866.1 hypothetical protein TGVAND_250220 [Toxoplasma gondii VAND]
MCKPIDGMVILGTLLEGSCGGKSAVVQMASCVSPHLHQGTDAIEKLKQRYNQVAGERQQRMKELHAELRSIENVERQLWPIIASQSLGATARNPNPQLGPSTSAVGTSGPAPQRPSQHSGVSQGADTGDSGTQHGSSAALSLWRPSSSSTKGVLGQATCGQPPGGSELMKIENELTLVRAKKDTLKESLRQLSKVWKSEDVYVKQRIRALAWRAEVSIVGSVSAVFYLKNCCTDTDLCVVPHTTTFSRLVSGSTTHRRECGDDGK